MTNTPVFDRYTEVFSKYVNMDAAKGVRDSYADQVSNIRKDTKLTEAGKRVEVARAYYTAKHSLDQIRNELQQNVAAEELRLSRQLFGPPDPSPAGIASHRDARTRATNLISRERALKAWEAAQIDGDQSMQRAIAHTAHQRNWTDVVQAHTSATAGAADTLRELKDLPTGGTAQKIAEDNLLGVKTPKEVTSLSVTEKAEALSSPGASE